MNIGVVSPWALSRKALSCLLESQGGFRVTLELENALDVFERIRQSHPDILLIDAVSPENDLQAVSRLRKLFPETRILLLWEALDEDFELQAIKAGAWGCVSKQSDPQALVKALRAVGNAEMWVSHHLATLIIRKSIHRRESPAEDSAELTHREWEILALVAGGHQNKEIARRLFISSNTIKAHLSAIYKKLNVRTRMGAALHYFQEAKRRKGRAVEKSADKSPEPAAPGRLSAPGRTGLATRRRDASS